jgi:DNA-binding CsgD family transcriptional regulator
MYLLTRRLIENLVPAIPFLILHFVKFSEIEMEIGILLIGWASYVSLANEVYILDVCFLLSFGIMLILKRTKLNLTPVLILMAFVFTLNICTMIMNNYTILELSKSIMLVWLMCFTIHSIFYKDFEPIKRFDTDNKLTESEKDIIKCLFEADPSNRNIANKLDLSEATIKKDLGLLYDKFEIIQGGSKRTELVTKLIRLGYKGE